MRVGDSVSAVTPRPEAASSAEPIKSGPPVAGIPASAGPHSPISGARPGGSSAPTANRETARATGALDATAALCSQLAHRQHHSLHRVRPPRLVPLKTCDAQRHPGAHERGESATRSRGSNPRRARHAFNVVAPTSTGPATPNDNRDASTREYPRRGPRPASLHSARRPERAPPPGQSRATSPVEPVDASRRRSAVARAAAPRPNRRPDRAPRSPARSDNATTTGGARRPRERAASPAPGAGTRAPARRPRPHAARPRAPCAAPRPTRRCPSRATAAARRRARSRRPAATRSRPGSGPGPRSGGAQADVASGADASARRRRYRTNSHTTPRMIAATTA